MDHHGIGRDAVPRRFVRIFRLQVDRPLSVPRGGFTLFAEVR
jgi:hypothetical protein